MTDKRIYLEFTIEMCNGKYSYDGSTATAQEQMEVMLPSLEFFSELDVGNLFKALALNIEAKFRQELQDQ